MNFNCFFLNIKDGFDLLWFRSPYISWRPQRAKNYLYFPNRLTTSLGDTRIPACHHLLFYALRETEMFLLLQRWRLFVTTRLKARGNKETCSHMKDTLSLTKTNNNTKIFLIFISNRMLSLTILQLRIFPSFARAFGTKL